MSKQNIYREKTKPILMVLYVVVAVILIVALAMMYMKDRARRREYKNMVLEAMSSEGSLDIASVKTTFVPDSEKVSPTPEVTVAPTETVVPTDTPAPTATPTEAPTSTPAPTDTPKPTETMGISEDISLPTVFVPEGELVDETLAKGLKD